MKTLFYFAFFVASYVLMQYGEGPTAHGQDNGKKPHFCSWQECEAREHGDTEYIPRWGYDAYTDGELAERTHFYYPALSYEQIEDFIFGPVDTCYFIVNQNNKFAE